MAAPRVYDEFIETEEFITAEEYLHRRERGEIDPRKIRIAPPRIGTDSFGGFIVKLKLPRYCSPFDKKTVP